MSKKVIFGAFVTATVAAGAFFYHKHTQTKKDFVEVPEVPEEKEQQQPEEQEQTPAVVHNFTEGQTEGSFYCTNCKEINSENVVYTCTYCAASDDHVLCPSCYNIDDVKQAHMNGVPSTDPNEPIARAL